MYLYVTLQEVFGDKKLMIILIGILIGMLVSLPIGPQGALSVQRSINMGWKAGFLSGLGAALSDIIYSSTALFGVSFLDAFIKKNQSLISIITGLLFFAVGAFIFYCTFKQKELKETVNGNLTISNFLLGLTNPLNFLIFLTIYARLGIKFDKEIIAKNFLLIGSIFLGSICFWLIVSNLINRFTRNLKLATIFKINRFIALFIMSFGVYSILQGVFYYK